MKTDSPMLALWGWPIVLAVVSGVGLFCGLWGDGAWDWAAWIGLGVPTLAAVWFSFRGRGTRR
jgi:hypothetical protein